MPTIDVVHNPGLTKEETLEIFRSYLGTKYKIVPTSLWEVDFLVVRSGWTGVAVTLKQKAGKTAIHFCPDVPGATRRKLFGSLAKMWAESSASGVMEDVKHVIETATEFHRAASAEFAEIKRDSGRSSLEV